jgi:Ca-activated chloride channel family protein
MTFLWPAMLILLLAIPLLVLIYSMLQRRRRRLLENARSLGCAPNPAGTGRGPGLRRHIPMAFFLVGLTILLVGLARPQTVIAVPRVEGTVILAFDVSGSMAADDLKPTRMEAAKQAARDFVEHQPSTVQIGVVAFSDGGFAVQAPTNDQASILAAIDRLTPERGTSVAQGILASLNTIANGNGQDQGVSPSLPQATPGSAQTQLQGQFPSSVIVLLSDGENNENPDPLAAAQTAADHSVRIDTVGIGSASGTNVHINGYTLFTQLDEATLQNIAQLTGGDYYNAQSTQALVSIYDHLNPQLIVKPEEMEVTSVFAGAGIAALLIGGIFSLIWFNRLP